MMSCRVKSASRVDLLIAPDSPTTANYPATNHGGRNALLVAQTLANALVPA